MPIQSALSQAMRKAVYGDNVPEEGEDVEDVEDTAEAVLTVAVA
ncbi:hypothetical protein ACWGM0_11685 [Sphingomonas bisphenolicum]